MGSLSPPRPKSVTHMPQRLDSLAIVLTLLGGHSADAPRLVGGAVTSQLALRGLVPYLFPPRTVQVRTAFQLIDNDGWLRSQLGKNGLTFFEQKTGEVIVGLDSERPQLLLYNRGTNTSVRLSPTGPYAIQAAQSVARHTSVRLPHHLSPGSLKPGILMKDGRLVWEVAEGWKAHDETTGTQ